MALTDAGLVIAANAVDAAVTHMQAHSGAPGAAGTSNVISGGRVATNGTVDADGDITWVGNFTEMPASQAVSYGTLWTASTGGTLVSIIGPLTGDATANAAGDVTITLVENNVAS